jgi:hypothetical protein
VDRLVVAEDHVGRQRGPGEVLDLPEYRLVAYTFLLAAARGAKRA